MRGLLDAPVVDDVAAVDGVAAAVPEIYGIGQIVGSDGDPLGGNGLPTQAGTGSQIPRSTPGRSPTGAPEGPGEVVVDKASADDGDLEVGDATTIRTDPVDVTVVGIAAMATPAPTAPARGPTRPSPPSSPSRSCCPNRAASPTSWWRPTTA